MKKNLIRLLALSLALLMLAPCLFACGKKGDGEETGSEGLDDMAVSTSADSDSEQNKYLPASQDFQQYTYRFAVRGDQSSSHQYMTYVEGDTLKSDAVNIAFYNRYKFLENYYNIKYEVVTINHTNGMVGKLEQAAMSGEDFADVIFDIAGAIMKSAITNGYLMDINKLEGFNLDASYWDQRIQQEYRIEGKLFTLEGDYTIYDEMRTHAVAVNKDMYDDLGYNDTYGSPYAMVEAGKWTFETMLEMSKNTSDFNGNASDMTVDSRWAIVSEGAFPFCVYLGTGNKIIEVENGSLNVSLADDTKYQNTLNIIEYCVDNIHENDEVILADRLTGDIWGQTTSIFTGGRALFRTSTLTSFMNYRNMTDVFGILPIPKYDEEQPYYYSWCSGQAHMPLMIPVTALDHIDTTVAITEGMAYFSKYMAGGRQSVLDAFYENMTYAKLCRAPEDYKMLELVFSQKTFDID